MRQTLLTCILFVSSVAGTMVVFHLSEIAPSMSGMSIHFSQNSASAKRHSL